MLKHLLISLVFLLAVAGCNSVRTNTTVFSDPEHVHRGRIVVINPDDKARNTLEFRHYKKQFEAKLAQAGYTIVDSRDEAQYIAFVSYGIDDGTERIVTYPVYGQIERNGNSIKLEPRVMDVLVYLAEHPGQVVSREELEDAVWENRIVSYDSLTSAIQKLRKAFADDARHVHNVVCCRCKG